MIVLVDERIDRQCEGELLARGHEVIKLPACEILQKPVSAHPDMLLFIGKGKLFCHKKYYAIAKKEIDLVIRRTDLSLLLSDETWGEKYPADVLFNAAPIQNKLICNEKSVSKYLIDAYGEENLIKTKQGYTKCSVCTVGDGAIITADVSVARAVRNEGIDVLLLSASHVKLDGYNEGFIGGASGDDGEHIFFCGNIDAHPEGDKINEFCEAHGRRAVSLSEDPLYDYGSLIFI